MSEVADVLVIGAGPSGGVVARHLAERGFGVVGLEQGSWHSASDYPGTDATYELRETEDWHKDPNVRGLPQDYPTDTSESDISPVMFNAVGGSAIHYGALWSRLLPGDFRVRSSDGVADDWPITYQDLEPFYDKTDHDFGVSGRGGDPAYPSGMVPSMPGMPITDSGRKFAEGMSEKGWHWWPGRNAIPTQDYGHLAACVRYGACVSGCPNGSKATVDLTHWPEAFRHGAALITGARVHEVTVDERGRVTGAVYVDRDGIERHQRANVVVMAANGVGTSRLLLLSTSPQHPDGLANSSGLVGRRLMLHPHSAVFGVYDDDLEGWLGPMGEYLYSLQFYDTDPSRGFVRGAKWAMCPPGGPMLVPLLEQLTGRPTWGPGIQERIRDLTGHVLMVAICSEDLPDESNRVVLDPVLTDTDGIPAPRIQYRQSEENAKLLSWHADRVVEAMSASGCRETITMPLWPDEPGHLLGTARMGEDPAASVVDDECRSHDVSNLFVVDGSVFVTAGGVNPTSTIVALALRCASQLADRARDQKVPA